MEKIKLMIAGTEYSIATDDNLEYVAQLGEELDKSISTIMRDSSKLSVTQAAILVALENLDKAKKGETSAENLRSQIQGYLEDAARARTDAEISKREAERLTKEISALRNSKK